MRRPYSQLSGEELVEELDAVSSALSGAILELSEVKVQYLWLFHQGYQNSHESSVAGRDRSGEIAAGEIKEDETRLTSNIESLMVIRDFLAELLRYRRAG